MSEQPRTIPISLVIDADQDMDFDDRFYDEAFYAFKRHIARMGLDPDKFFYDKWRITCVAEEKVNNSEEDKP